MYSSETRYLIFIAHFSPSWHINTYSLEPHIATTCHIHFEITAKYVLFSFNKCFDFVACNLHTQADMGIHWKTNEIDNKVANMD